MTSTTVSNWTEGILLSLLFVVVLTFVVVGFNGLYNKNYDLGLSDNETEQLFIDYQGTAQNQIEGGEVQFDAQQGITLKSSYGIAVDAIKISWSFISGGWVEKVAAMIGLGEAGTALARTFRILFYLSLVFGLLYALFKIVI